MNDKTTPMATSPAPTPSKETETGMQTAPAKKVEERKAESAATPAAEG
jgi:hypothetical protein